MRPPGPESLNLELQAPRLGRSELVAEPWSEDVGGGAVAVLVPMAPADMIVLEAVEEDLLRFGTLEQLRAEGDYRKAFAHAKRFHAPLDVEEIRHAERIEDV